MYTSRYQPLAGARHLIFSHDVLNLLTYKKADTAPSSLNIFFFVVLQHLLFMFQHSHTA